MYIRFLTLLHTYSEGAKWSSLLDGAVVDVENGLHSLVNVENGLLALVDVADRYFLVNSARVAVVQGLFLLAGGLANGADRERLVAVDLVGGANG